MERRGGFRFNPLNILLDSLDRSPKRRVATAVRGVYIRPDGLIDDWREIGATGEPAFENSWVNYGSPWETTAFRKDGEGTVHIKGLVKTGTIGQSAFTLPVGYRPAKDVHFTSISNDAIAKLHVLADGTVVPAAGSSTWFTLRCMFSAEA